MPWARLDDNFHSHPKVREAWRCRPALALWALGLSYAMRHTNLEGRIPTAFVEDQLPDEKERAVVVKALEQAGLWERNGSGWVIHDFHDYNPSQEDVDARRAADRERKRRSRSS